MKLTKEEAIKRHRELWGWLAENPMKEKTDWPGWERYDAALNDCFLCEYVLKSQKNDSNRLSICDYCPVWFKENGFNRGTVSYCLGGLFYGWEVATNLEERSRLAALIRDLPEKKDEAEIKVGKFKVGDKVRVREDLVPGQTYGDIHLLNEMADLRGQVGTIFIISRDGNFGLDIGYVWDASMLERVPAEEPAPRFKIGDKVVPIGISWENWTLEKYLNFPSRIPAFLREKGYLRVSKINNDKYYCGTDSLQGLDGFFESELIPYIETPKYHAPQNYSCCEIVVNQYDRKTIYNGPATICIINLEGKDYKGIARCAPDDTFNERFGQRLAETRALIKAYRDIERRLIAKASQREG
jgi:hypothetical protein